MVDNVHVQLSLEVIGYIGVCVSLFFLAATVIALVSLRYVKQAVHGFNCNICGVNIIILIDSF